MSSPTTSAPGRRPMLRPSLMFGAAGNLEGSFILIERLGGDADPPHGVYRRQRLDALVKKVIDVDIDQRLPRKDAHQRAEREERAKRNGRLATLARALASDDQSPQQGARQQRDQDCGRDSAPKEQAHHP